jgi:hypothetical protein
MMTRFTLYSRSYCHLCEDMLSALRAFMAREGLACEVAVLDIDTDLAVDQALAARYDELVPVLVGEDPDGPELCHYFLDEAALRRHLGLVLSA